MSENEERHPHGEVRTEVVEDHILVMTFDRVEKKNSFTPKTTHELAAALTRLDEDPDLFVGVLTFAGEHTTAGLDMPLFFGSEAGSDATDVGAAVDPFGLKRRLRKPLITAIQGTTYTVGIEIALAGDIVIAADDARLCQMEPRRGLAPLGGATIRYVQRSGWGNAMYHLLRADHFDAAEALRVGLVQEVVPAGTQRERAVEVATEMLACSPSALVHAIANARLALEESPQAAADAVPAMAGAVMATEDFNEGITSFIERRPARFTGR